MGERPEGVEETAAGGTVPERWPGWPDGGAAAEANPQPLGGKGPRSKADGARGAVVAGVLALAVIGGLWLLARGAPSAAGDSTRPAPTATVSVRERFGEVAFPTARAVIRRQPVQIAPLPELDRGSRATPEARPTGPVGAIGTRSAAQGDAPFGGDKRARPTRPSSAGN